MKVLVACEESQAVTIELRKLGHEAYSCDIIECSGGHPEWHIKGDALKLLDGDHHCLFWTMDGVGHITPKRWDMIIAFPPCTYLTAAGAVRLFNKDHTIRDLERYQKGVEAARFFMAFLEADCQMIAVENPVMMKCFGIPKYTQKNRTIYVRGSLAQAHLPLAQKLTAAYCHECGRTEGAVGWEHMRQQRPEHI